jgi:hypothetical protein
MTASTPEELLDLVAAEPDASPSIFLADDSLAAWFYDHLSLREVRSAFERDPDPDECKKWRLSGLEWKNQVEMAIIALSAADRSLQTISG